MSKIRIIGGSLGSQQISTPPGNKTHPMSERVRSSLFNILGDINGLNILDSFAGSGALGLEAISRGANSATFIEKDRLAQKVIEENIHTLGVSENAKLIKTSVANWLKTDHEIKFDLIFIDPPYYNLQLSTAFMLKRYLNFNGLMVLSYPGRELTPTVNGVVVVDNRSYGDAALAFYRLDSQFSE